MASQTASPPRAPSRQTGTWLLLFLILAVGTFLRFHTLGRSLWPDECFSLILARMPWSGFLRILWWGEANMALYYLFMRGWLHLGDSEVWLQSLSALTGVLAIPAVYALGDRFLSRKAGLVAAALLAVHTYHIEHSEELRSYSLLVLLVVLSTYAFLALLEHPERKILWAFYVLLSSLCLYTQTFAIFVLAAQWLAIGSAKVKRLGILKSLAAIAAVGILSAPMAAVMLMRDQGQLVWIPRPSLAGSLVVLRSIVGAGSFPPRESALSALLLVLYVLAWLLAIGSLLHTRGDRAQDSMARAPLVLIVWWLVFPFAAMLALSFLKPILYPRYLLMSVPAAVLLAAQGLVTLERFIPRGRLIASAALLTMISLSLIGDRRFEASLNVPGDSWRGLTHFILSHQESGDAIIFYTLSGGHVYDYYVGRDREAGGTGFAPPKIFPRTSDSANIQNCVKPYHRVWLVLYQIVPTPQGDAINGILLQAMQSHFQLVHQEKFAVPTENPGENASIYVGLYAAPVGAN